MKRLYIFSFIIVFSFNLPAQAPQSWTSADIYLGIKKLNVLGSVLYVAAHPDDENTRLITYYSKERLYRTGYLSMTRGDGGQNLIGDEQGIELGLIRTQELLAARRIDGGEQFFTRAYDFGYSKSPIETFTKWDKEKILSDVVWIIRKFQPDVIITRFPTTGEGGHGHHTASAIVANDAFTAAADPTRFPEQFKYGAQPWQAKRILWNSFNFGNTNLTSNDQFKFDVGAYNPLLGKSYGEISAESRSQHKSQGFGVPAGRGEALEYFKTTGGDAPVNDLFDGVDVSWKRVKGGEIITRMVDSISSSFDFLHPESSVKSLVRLYGVLNSMADGYWKNKKLDEVKVLIEQCSGLWADVFTNEQFAVQTDSIRFSFQFNNRLGVNTTLKRIIVDDFDSTLNQSLGKNRNINFAKTFFIPPTKPLTQPYWLQNKMSEGYFNVTDQQIIGKPDVNPAYVVNLTMEIEGYNFTFSRNVKYKFTDPVRGEVYWPLSVIAPFSLKIIPEVGIVTNETYSYQSIYTSYKNNNRVKVFGVPGVNDSFYLQKNETRNTEIKQTLDVLPLLDPKNSNQILPFQFAHEYMYKREGNQMVYDQIRIKYDHIPAITYFKESKIMIKAIDLKTYNKKIGYIVGAGDKVPEALEQMGYEVTLLGNKELSRNNLSQFDAIITGIRAYNTNDWMGTYYDKLMKYVENGGNLIIQYNTSNFISSVRSKIGPYPFTINRNRITDENAQVRILIPEHPAFNFPNKIYDDDFKGWVQERSIYHATDSSGKYEKLLSMNDPGENPDDGSLVVAKYGKGYFTYTGLVFFRQLPTGVPGAYRLLANLIALNRKKAF